MTDSENNIEEKINTIWHFSLGFAAISLILTFIDSALGPYLMELFGGIFFPLSSIFGTAILLQSRNKVSLKLLAITLAIVLNIFIASMVGNEVTLYDIFINRDCGSQEYSGYYTLDRFAVPQYNRGYTEYDGQSNVKGVDVKKLIRETMTHNRDNSKYPTLWIQIRVSEPSDSPLKDAESIITNSNEAENLSEEDLKEYNLNINNELKKIASSRVYAVACGYDPETGYVTDINVVQVEEKETTNIINKNINTYN